MMLKIIVTQNLALIGLVVSEIKTFQKNGHIHVYSPGAEAVNPLGSKLFHKCQFGHLLQDFHII